MAHFHADTPFLHSAALFFTVLIQRPLPLISSLLSSRPLHSFCLHLCASVFVAVTFWHETFTDTSITSSINSPPCPHPRLSPWHSFSSSYLLHTGSISTSATVEARLLPVVNFSLPPTYTHIDRAILSSLFEHSSSLIVRCMNSVCVFLLGTFSGINTDCVGASSLHRDWRPVLRLRCVCVCVLGLHKIGKKWLSFVSMIYRYIAIWKNKGNFTRYM